MSSFPVLGFIEPVATHEFDSVVGGGGGLGRVVPGKVLSVDLASRMGVCRGGFFLPSAFCCIECVFVGKACVGFVHLRGEEVRVGEMIGGEES